MLLYYDGVAQLLTVVVYSSLQVVEFAFNIMGLHDTQ